MRRKHSSAANTLGPVPSTELLHDLRTATNHIIGYSEMLVEQAEAEGQSSFMPDLQNIHVAGHRLLTLVDDREPSRKEVPRSNRPRRAFRTNVQRPAQPGGGMTAQTAAGATQSWILVVDDNEMNCDLLSRPLKQQGYGVVSAASGAQALDVMRARAFDLVLLDVLMPDMNGYAVLQQLKADETLRHVPVIMVSALNKLDIVVRCIELGAEDYLAKPFNPILLKARISASLEKKHARDRDIIERRLAEQVLAALVEASDDANVSWTLDGVITTWNRGAEKMYGYTAAEVVGRPMAILLPPDHADYEALLINPIKRGELVNQIETVRCHKDGSRIDISLAAAPIRDGSGTVTGGWAIARDITARKQIDRMKSEFISTVSHELRTPLTSIRGALGLVTGGVTGTLPPQAKTMLDIAYKNSELLVRLINDILDIEKIESGKMTFDEQVLELTPLVAQALDANRAYAEQFGVSYLLTTAEPGIKVSGNADRLMQVLNNLLANAAKFSPANGTVEVSVVRRGAMVRVAVVDQGTGIPDEFRSRIFQKFAQADSSDTRQKGGTGLGLSISRAIVEKHGGQIDFMSDPGNGTTFYFDLPLYPEAGQPPYMDMAAAACAHILICEDDHDVALLLSTLLQQEDCVTDIAYDTAQAKELLGRQQYDGMTLDLKFGDEDGIAFIRELCGHEQTRALAIIVVSVRAREAREELHGNTMGVIDWIEKPIDLARLGSAVQRVVQDRKRQGPRILHIEDDPDIVAVVAHLLRNVATMSSAPGVREAHRTLEHESVDLVILDLRLSAGSGMELLPLLSRRGIPVVIFSAYTIPTEAAAQASAALVKASTSNQSLFATITAILKGTTRRTEVSPQDVA